MGERCLVLPIDHTAPERAPWARVRPAAGDDDDDVRRSSGSLAVAGEPGGDLNEFVGGAGAVEGFTGPDRQLDGAAGRRRSRRAPARGRIAGGQRSAGRAGGPRRLPMPTMPT